METRKRRRCLTTKEVAERLGLSTRTIYRMIDRGHIPVLNFGGTYLFTADTLNAWLASRSARGKDGQKTAPSPPPGE